MIRKQAGNEGKGSILVLPYAEYGIEILPAKFRDVYLDLYKEILRYFGELQNVYIVGVAGNGQARTLDGEETIDYEAEVHEYPAVFGDMFENFIVAGGYKHRTGKKIYQKADFVTLHAPANYVHVAAFHKGLTPSETQENALQMAYGTSFGKDPAPRSSL
ncbi:hypothetical protein ABW19_dt0208401 [Dactylella cylindrospora]|nr:hypothetical protein ABW19_dt0208401 [Dactylella cylindrospora]